MTSWSYGIGLDTGKSVKQSQNFPNLLTCWIGVAWASVCHSHMPIRFLISHGRQILACKLALRLLCDSNLYFQVWWQQCALAPETDRVHLPSHVIFSPVKTLEEQKAVPLSQLCNKICFLISQDSVVGYVKLVISTNILKYITNIL